jgi:hypothetical protein
MAGDFDVSGFVAAHVSAVETEDPSGRTLMAGQDGHSCAQNVSHGVFAERSAQLFATDIGKIGARSTVRARARKGIECEVTATMKMPHVADGE